LSDSIRSFPFCFCGSSFGFAFTTGFADAAPAFGGAGEAFEAGADDISGFCTGSAIKTLLFNYMINV
jgi:hypothetical protein